MKEKRVTMEVLAAMVKRGFDVMEERFNGVEDRLEKVEVGLGKVEDRLTRIELGYTGRLERLEDGMRLVKTKLQIKE